MKKTFFTIVLLIILFGIHANAQLDKNIKRAYFVAAATHANPEQGLLCFYDFTPGQKELVSYYSFADGSGKIYSWEFADYNTMPANLIGFDEGSWKHICEKFNLFAGYIEEFKPISIPTAVDLYQKWTLLPKVIINEVPVNPNSRSVSGPPNTSGGSSSATPVKH